MTLASYIPGESKLEDTYLCKAKLEDNTLQLKLIFCSSLSISEPLTFPVETLMQVQVDVGKPRAGHSAGPRTFWLLHRSRANHLSRQTSLKSEMYSESQSLVPCLDLQAPRSRTPESHPAPARAPEASFQDWLTRFKIPETQKASSALQRLRCASLLHALPILGPD